MAIKSLQYGFHTFDISYEILNPSAKVDIIFLHGWGSNKALMKSVFSKQMDSFRHIYIDLPGFGSSTSPMALKTDDYHKILERFLCEINVTKNIIVGHSYGGKLATLLNPELLVLLSSSGILVPKPLSIKLKIAVFKTLKIFGFTKLRSLFVSSDAKDLNEYMYTTFKNVVNEDFRDKFSEFKNKALLCWGVDDTATPLYTAYEIEKLISKSIVKEFDGDHYFFMKHANDISLDIEDEYLGDRD